ncbi:MAG: hypothetical protein GXO42_02775 [bacterium]|nr:hypothetical protein [bacterium]
MRAFITLYDFVFLILLILLGLLIFLSLSPTSLFYFTAGGYRLVSTYNTIYAQIFYSPVRASININGRQFSLAQQGFTLPYLLYLLCHNATVNVYVGNVSAPLVLKSKQLQRVVRRQLQQIYAAYSNFVEYIELRANCGKKNFTFTAGNSTSVHVCLGKTFVLKNLHYNLTLIVCK